MFIDIEEDSGRKIELIVLHCSDSDYEHHDHVSTINQWHKERGWSMIGYNWFISKKHGIQKGRPVGMIPAHVRGHNKNSIGICLGGRKEFSKGQFKNLRILLAEIFSFYNLDLTNVVLHNQLDSRKTCPNYTLEEALLTEL